MIGGWRLPPDPNVPGNQVSPHWPFHARAVNPASRLSTLESASRGHFCPGLEVIRFHEDPWYGQRDRGLQLPENKTREGQRPNTPHQQLANTEPPWTRIATFESDKEERIPVRVANFTDRRVTLRKGTLLGDMTEVVLEDDAG